jgi:hypothetical protein
LLVAREPPKPSPDRACHRVGRQTPLSKVKKKIAVRKKWANGCHV